jgi:hypothetical protein
VFVSDIRRAAADLGWQPRVAPAEGVCRLYKWVEQNRDLFDGDARPKSVDVLRHEGRTLPTEYRDRDAGSEAAYLQPVRG